jgi:hypothetical protein
MLPVRPSAHGEDHQAPADDLPGSSADLPLISGSQYAFIRAPRLVALQRVPGCLLCGRAGVVLRFHSGEVLPVLWIGTDTRRRQRDSQSKRDEMPKLVVVKYLLFCLGAAFMQLAYMRQPDRGNLRLRTASVLHSPVLFLDPRFQLLVMALALAAWAAEIILGFVLIGWWAGVFLWIPAFMVANILVLGRANPGPPFFIGFALTMFAVVSLAL